MTNLTPQQNFEEKIKDRLRDSIGDIIPDEMLSEMIKRSLEDFFFKDVEVREGYSTVKRPGWFHKQWVVRMEKRLNKWVERHLALHGQRMIEEMEKKFIEESPRIIFNAFTKHLMDVPMLYGQNGYMELERRIREKGISI